LSNNSLDTKQDEQEVLKQVALGDERAFNRIVRKYSQVIYPYLLYWLKSPQLAEEVAQDVFLRIWKNRHKLPDISNFSGYVYVITRNCVNSQFERGLPETEAPDIIQIDQTLTNPQTDLETKELATIMSRAIDSLPPRRKEVFLLSRNEQLTYEEIAARLGISRSTVREHMVEALVFLRTYLKRNAGVIITLLYALINQW